jgi:hypothetical protein
MNNPDTTQILSTVASIVIILGLLAAILVFFRRIAQGRGSFGSVLKQNRELIKESLAAAKEGLQVEKELLAAQKETNELLKRALARLENKA